MEKERIVWLDWMRVIACLMVMTVHATEPFYLGGEGTQILTETDAWWVSLFEGLVRMCVPLFVIASSYLLFPIKTSATAFFRRRAVRILVPFAIWSVFYALYNAEPVNNLRDLAWNFNYAAGHLWFVYMLIGLYLLMPLLSPWAEKVGKRELQVYLMLCLLTSVIPLLRDELSGGQTILEYGPTGIPSRALYPLWGEASWNPYGTFYYFSGFMGYLLLGLYLRRFTVVKSWGRTLLVAVPCLTAGFAISFCGFLRRVYEVGGGEFPVLSDLPHAVWLETTLVNDTLSVALMTIGWVVLMRKWFEGKATTSASTKVVMRVSKASYGMYLCHMVVLGLVSGFVRELWGLGSAGQFGALTTPLQIVSTALVSFVVVAVVCVGIQRIPRIGKYVMG